MSRMTTEQLTRLVNIAGQICIVTPRRKNKSSPQAYVPWSLVLELRELLTEMGVDLERARATFERLSELDRERRRASS